MLHSETLHWQHVVAQPVIRRPMSRAANSSTTCFMLRDQPFFASPARMRSSAAEAELRGEMSASMARRR